MESECGNGGASLLPPRGTGGGGPGRGSSWCGVNSGPYLVVGNVVVSVFLIACYWRLSGNIQVRTISFSSVKSRIHRTKHWF